MPDDLTLGELARTQAAFERRVKADLKAVDDRHADLAGKMVPTDLWKAEHEALEADVQHLREDVHEAVDRIERTSLERMGVLNGRIDSLARWQRTHDETHASSSQWSRNKTLTVVGIIVTALATVVGAWIAAVLAAKGVH